MIGNYPWPGAKTPPGEISKTQICQISNHLFSNTYPLLTAIKLQAWPSFKQSSLHPQFTLQLLTSLGTSVADKSFLYVVEQMLSTACDCRHARSRLCDCFMCCHVHRVFAFQHSQPSEEQEPALPEQTSLTHSKIFVELLLEGSNATNYLRGASQPSRRFDRWLWPQQTWGPSLGWHMRLLLKGEADRLRCSYGGCKAYSQIASCTIHASGRQGQVSYHDGMYDPCETHLYAHTHTH